MAGEKGNVIWLIVLLAVVAAVLGVLSFSKEKVNTVSVSSQDMLVNGMASVVTATAESSLEIPVLKPAKTETDYPQAALSKPVASVVIPPVLMPSKASFAIQVYSFKDKSRAESALRRLKAKGHKSYVMESDLGARGVWYRVRVGSFTTEDEARAALDVITSEFKSGIIVTE